jgi:hypothetical protein
MPTIEQLIQTIDDRIGDVNREIASLQNARSALTSNGASPSTSPQPRARPHRQPTRRTPRRTAASNRKVLRAETAEGMLAKSDGLTTAAIAMQAGAERDHVLALLRGLEAAGRVRRTGQRRGTRWHAITDEDRIQERAAELEARTSRRS